MAFVCSHDIVDKCVSRTLICYLTIKQAFGSEISVYISHSAPYIIFYVNLFFPLTRMQPLMVNFSVFLRVILCVASFFYLILVADIVPVVPKHGSFRDLKSGPAGHCTMTH
jgi:hypothetical protein